MNGQLVYRTEYYEPKLFRWVSIWESTTEEGAREYLGYPIIGNPPQRVALYEKKGVRKVTYKLIRVTREIAE